MSVPEAARAARWAPEHERVHRWMVLMNKHRLSSHIGNNAEEAMALADAEVAAASVELQQEVDRLSAECEALRGTVAEERATIGRALARLAGLVRALREIGQMTGYRYPSSTQDAVDVARAALASPTKGDAIGDARPSVGDILGPVSPVPPLGAPLRPSRVQGGVTPTPRKSDGAT